MLNLSTDIPIEQCLKILNSLNMDSFIVKVRNNTFTIAVFKIRLFPGKYSTPKLSGSLFQEENRTLIQGTFNDSIINLSNNLSVLFFIGFFTLFSIFAISDLFSKTHFLIPDDISAKVILVILAPLLIVVMLIVRNRVNKAIESDRKEIIKTLEIKLNAKVISEDT